MLPRWLLVIVLCLAVRPAWVCADVSAPPFPADSTAALLSHALHHGNVGHVEVNQRMLVDKMLARYSSELVVFRELMQNADDARATRLTIHLLAHDAPKTHSHESGGLSQEDEDTPTDVCAGPSCLSEIRVCDNGRAFDEADWQRIAAIAEGNPDESGRLTSRHR